MLNMRQVLNELSTLIYPYVMAEKTEIQSDYEKVSKLMRQGRKNTDSGIRLLGLRPSSGTSCIILGK